MNSFQWFTFSYGHVYCLAIRVVTIPGPLISCFNTLIPSCRASWLAAMHKWVRKATLLLDVVWCILLYHYLATINLSSKTVKGQEGDTRMAGVTPVINYPYYGPDTKMPTAGADPGGGGGGVMGVSWPPPSVSRWLHHITVCALCVHNPLPHPSRSAAD